MSTRPTNDQIIAEITELKRLAPLIPAQTAFGDSNEEAIRAEIAALERLWDEDDAHDAYPTDADAVKDQLDPDMDDDEADRIAAENQHALDAAVNAIYWRMGDSTDVPSAGWRGLVS